MQVRFKCVLLLWFGLVSLGANAEPPVVLDNQSLEGLTPKPIETSRPQASAAAPQAAETKLQQLQRTGKMSPAQRAALAKATSADSNKQAGNSFLAANKIKPGVITLPSGVQYKIVKSGAGKKPTEESAVRCRYKGKLIDGSTFDKIEDKSPAPIKVVGLLPGLKEAVKMMPAGSKWEVVIPPELAYGEQGNRAVGANAVLIYEIEIIGVM